VDRFPDQADWCGRQRAIVHQRDGSHVDEDASQRAAVIRAVTFGFGREAIPAERRCERAADVDDSDRAD
jgi:hypothetical protein